MCNVCDKILKKENVNKHSESKRHIGLSSVVVNGFTVKNPEFMNFDNIFRKYRDEYDRKVETYTINCCFSFVFDNNQTPNVELKKMISLLRPTYIRQQFSKKLYSLERNEHGYKYSFISEMKREFNAYFPSMRIEIYL